VVNLPVKLETVALNAADARQAVRRVGKHVVRVADHIDADVGVVVGQQRVGDDAVEWDERRRLLLLLLLPLLLGVSTQCQPANRQVLDATSVTRPTSLLATIHHYTA